MGEHKRRTRYQICRISAGFCFEPDPKSIYLVLLIRFRSLAGKRLRWSMHINKTVFCINMKPTLLSLNVIVRQERTSIYMLRACYLQVIEPDYN